MKLFIKFFIFFILLFSSSLMGADKFEDVQGDKVFSLTQLSNSVEGNVCTASDGELSPASRHKLRTSVDGEINVAITAGESVVYYFQKPNSSTPLIQNSIEVKAGEELYIIFKSTVKAPWGGCKLGYSKRSYKATINFIPPATHTCPADEPINFGNTEQTIKKNAAIQITPQNTTRKSYIINFAEDGIFDLKMASALNNDLNLGMKTLLNGEKCEDIETSSMAPWIKNGATSKYEKPIQVYKNKPIRVVIDSNEEKKNGNPGFDMDFIFTPNSSLPPVNDGQCTRLEVKQAGQTNGDNALHLGKKLQDGSILVQYLQTISTSKAEGNHYLEVKADEDGTINLSSKNKKMSYYISSTNGNCAQSGNLGKDSYKIKKGQSVFIGIKTPTNLMDTLDISFALDNPPFPGSGKCTNGNDADSNNPSFVYKFSNTSQAEIKSHDYSINVKNKLHSRVFYKYTVPVKGRLLIEVKNTNPKDEKVNLIRIDDSGHTPINQTCTPNIFITSGTNQFVSIRDAKPDKTYWVVIDTINDYSTDSTLPYMLHATFVPEGVYEIPAPIYPDEALGNSGDDVASKPLPPISGEIPKGDGIENLTNLNVYKIQKFKDLVYGGAGTYTNGDMLTIGNSVVNINKAGYLHGGNFSYINHDNLSSTNRNGVSNLNYLNSSKETLQLPDNLKGKDVKIRWARLYWQGYVSKLNTTKVNVSELIKGYRSIRFRAGSTINSKMADSVNVIGANNVSSNKCALATMGLAFHYGASTDVTNIVKDYIEKSDESEFVFSGGNIITSDGEDDHICNNRLGTDNIQQDKLGRYGGWSLVVVYDVNRDEVKDKDGQPYFKPKQVSIYNGYELLIPEFDYASKPTIEIPLSGFYTPNSTDIKAKITFLAFAGERKIASTDRNRQIDEGFYILDANNNKEHSFGTNAFQSSIFFQGTDEKYYKRDGGGGGSVTGLNLNGTNGTNDFYSGMDLQVYQVGKFMKPKQTSTIMKLAIPGQSLSGGTAEVDQSFVGMLGFSTDLYVPEICYDDEIYNTKGWLGFFDRDGNRRKNPLPGTNPIDSGTVVAGEQLFYRVLFKNKGQEDAVGVYVTANLQGRNTYTTNSSQMDNSLTANQISSAKLVYLKDQESGAWSDHARKTIVNDSVYNNKRLVTYADNTLRYFIGKGAGQTSLNSLTPSGGTIRARGTDNIFVEYNATVGQYYRYVVPKYTAGFKVVDPSGTITLADFNYDTPLKSCTNKKRLINITLLNGLKVVNQNFTDSKSDKGKNINKDERLYTQIAQKPFNANLIYKPDFSNLFECLNVNASTGKCDNFNIPNDAKDLFDKDGKIIIGLQDFKLDGNLYLSLIRAQDVGACRWLRHTDKIPFVVDGKRYAYDYKVNLLNKNLIKIGKLEVEDAFRGLSFMLTYYPSGLDANSTGVSGHTSYQGYLDAHLATLSDDERKALKEQIKHAKLIFGTEPSEDGSFHVCASDSFVTRPAYFDVNMNNFTKFARLVNPNNTGDITAGSTTKNAEILRIGGQYRDNIDIATNTVFAASANDKGVPNYNAEIGGDLGKVGFQLKGGYENSSGDGIDDSKKISEIKTFLKPFISNECRNSLPVSSMFQERGKVTNEAKIKDAKSGIAYSYQMDTKSDKFGLITCSAAERKENGGKCFDEANFRIWDRDKISLVAHFYAKSSVVNDGAIKMNIWNADELREQALKEPKDKEKKYAVLTTGNLVNADNDDTLGKIFNYFNVGDVLVNLYDNTWTAQYGDQLWLNEYNSASCILNSASNDHDALGMVGCDVGMKEDKHIVLRYEPDRVEVAISGFSNDQGNTRTIGGNAVNYTYYNNPAPATIMENGTNVTKFNRALVGDLKNLAKISFDATAYLSNANYKDVVPSLFDGQLLEGKFDNKAQEVPRCGFSSDVNLDLIFGYDCVANGADPRCITDNKIIQKTTTAKDYTPFPGVNISYQIPAGTSFIADNQCANAPFDSRCFKYDEKWLVGTVEHQANNPGGGAGRQNLVPMPLNLAINFYSDANSRNLLNKRQDTNKQNNQLLTFNPKLPQYTLLSTGFSFGRSQSGVAYFNFDRSFKRPNRPLVILGSDFDINNATLNFNNSITTPQFNSNYDIVNAGGNRLLGTDGKAFTGVPASTTSTFTAPAVGLNSLNLATNLARIPKNKGAKIDQNFIAQNGFYAHFVYGIINYLENGGSASGLRNGVVVNVPSYLHCGQADNCTPAAGMPFGIAGSIFDNTIDYNSNLRYNIHDVYTAADIGANFVSQYIAQDTSVVIARSNQTGNPAGQEPVTFSRNRAANDVEIRVFTNPWFIYTPLRTDILTQNIGGTDTLYNYFNVSLLDAGTWGGEGQIKGGKTGHVGEYVGGKDFDSSSRDRTDDSGVRRKNMRIEW